MSLRRMLPFILINIVVSTVVMLAILAWWERRQTPEETTAAAAPTTGAVMAPSLPTPLNNPPPEAATETPDPNEPLVYVVQAGDTLGSIATEFDVPLQDIMTANGLTNPNIINAGQSLIIPIGGLAPPTEPPPAATELPPTQAILPTVTAEFVQGEINVVIAGVTGAGNLPAEAVFMRNTGSQAVALQGWTLSDQEGHVYTFDQITLFGGGEDLGAGISVHTETGQDSATDLYWGLEQAIWQVGDVVMLRNAAGILQADYTITAP